MASMRDVFKEGTDPSWMRGMRTAREMMDVDSYSEQVANEAEHACQLLGMSPDDVMSADENDSGFEEFTEEMIPSWPDEEEKLPDHRVGSTGNKDDDIVHVGRGKMSDGRPYVSTTIWDGAMTAFWFPREWKRADSDLPDLGD